jgi:hypothetical protein
LDITIIMGIVVGVVLLVVYSIVESGTEADYQDRRKHEKDEGPQILDEDDLE